MQFVQITTFIHNMHDNRNDMLTEIGIHKNIN